MFWPKQALQFLAPWPTGTFKANQWCGHGQWSRYGSPKSLCGSQVPSLLTALRYSKQAGSAFVETFAESTLWCLDNLLKTRILCDITLLSYLLFGKTNLARLFCILNILSLVADAGNTDYLWTFDSVVILDWTFCRVSCICLTFHMFTGCSLFAADVTVGA